jgi:tellurite resistance protein TerA
MPSLTKITLDKSNAATRLNLSKGMSDIKVKLQWNSQPAQQKKGFFASLLGSSTIDLDLGIYVELVDGKRFVIDPLQFAHDNSRKGSLSGVPFVLHSGDDRSGGGGELILVSGQNISRVKRLVVYTYIYEGAAQWRATDAHVHVEVPGQSPIDIVMGEQSDSRKMCALAQVEVGSGGGTLEVKRLMTFHTGHDDCDRAYSWGFQWSAGSK